MKASSTMLKELLKELKFIKTEVEKVKKIFKISSVVKGNMGLSFEQGWVFEIWAETTNMVRKINDKTVPLFMFKMEITITVHHPFTPKKNRPSNTIIQVLARDGAEAIKEFKERIK